MAGDGQLELRLGIGIVEEPHHGETGIFQENHEELADGYHACALVGILLFPGQHGNLGEDCWFPVF